MSYLDNISQNASVVNPREIIVMAYPKIGKTELCTMLPGSYVILDFEKGTDFFKCNKISINDVQVMSGVMKEFSEKKPHFDFIIFDTLTSFYNELVTPLSVMKYNVEEKKKQPLTWNITNLAYGAGQRYLRITTQEILKFFRKYCDTLILLGHVSDKTMGTTEGELNVKELDIEGKLKNILALKTDAIALLSRKEANKNYLSFTPSTGLIGGTRVPHLANKEFLISEKLPDGTLKAYWDQIFIK